MVDREKNRYDKKPLPEDFDVDLEQNLKELSPQEFLMALGVTLVVVLIAFADSVLAWIQQNLISSILFVVVVIGASAYLIPQYIKHRQKKRNELFQQVVSEIEKFQPSMNYEKEKEYHAELQGWLKRKFPEAKAEHQIGSSRPDIVIQGIAIEIKGPTKRRGLDSIPKKCTKYPQKFKEKIIVVLFDVQEDITEQHYKEMKNGIEKQFNAKVIRISS